MIEIKLPDKPKDKYQLNWWRLSISEHWCYFRRMHAIYYVDTPYEELFPKESGGVPLIDDWMIYENNRPTGRWTGWKSPENHPENWRNCFETEKEAKENAFYYLREVISLKQEQIKHIETLIREIA